MILHLVPSFAKRVERPSGYGSLSGREIVVRKPRSMPQTVCKSLYTHLGVGAGSDVNNEVAVSAGSVCASGVVSCGLISIVK